MLTILFKHLRLLAEEFVGAAAWPSCRDGACELQWAERDVLLQASRQAGFDVLQALIEPCAVALAHGLDQPDDDDDDDEDEDEEEDDDDEEEEEEAIVLVIDIGSTQLDVTLMKEKSGLLRVEKTHCDVELGGQHFAGKLAQHCIAQFKRQYGSDPSESPKAIAKLSGVRRATLFGRAPRLRPPHHRRRRRAHANTRRCAIPRCARSQRSSRQTSRSTHSTKVAISAFGCPERASTTCAVRCIAAWRRALRCDESLLSSFGFALRLSFRPTRKRLL